MSTMIRSLFAALVLSSSAFAHMEMVFPPPLRSKHNPFATNIDYSMTAPLSGASQFPCKGYLTDMGTAAGGSVQTWAQGAAVNLTLGGSAVHGGGTCQAAISTDTGKTWYVIHTFQGGCPLAPGSFDFTIPSDAEIGPALFAWTWYNNIGNREIYQNCASITIASGSGAAPKTAFKSRPDMFVANLANGCTTVETTDVLIPNPGPDVSTAGTAKQQAASGTCAPVNGIGGRASGSSGSSGSSGASGSESASPVASSSSSAVSIVVVPTSSATLSTFVTTTPSPSSVLASATGVAPVAQPTGTGTSSTGTSGLKSTVDGQCSGSQTCAGQSVYGSCCSQWGYCGDTAAHCGAGCMSAFGTCGMNGTTSTASRARHVRQFRI